jgi:hypothetical protein
VPEHASVENIDEPCPICGGQVVRVSIQMTGRGGKASRQDVAYQCSASSPSHLPAGWTPESPQPDSLA